MNGNSDRAYSRISSRTGYKELKLLCPGCSVKLYATGDSQNWGSVRRHLNVHVTKGELSEQAKVQYLKELGI